ncbi:MAG: META domain-containing protein [Opitutaceae bacterium]|nr:META domain-containing protein [Opitutaceae bacterium]
MTDAIWELVELRGVPAVAKDYPRHPTLRFHASTQRVSGYSGVNTFGGVYELTGAKLKLRLLMSTMMAGPEELMTLEQRYNATLGEVDGWRLTPAGLELSKGDHVVARFRPLPAAIGTAN